MAFTTDSAKIKRWREERQWSQEHLAEVAGIGLRTIQRIETGEQASKESLMALAAAFGVDVIDLTVDAASEARRIERQNKSRKLANLRLAFWINVGCYAFCMLVFAAICVIESSLVMLWPAIWWTVGMAGFGLIVVLVELVHRHERQIAEFD